MHQKRKKTGSQREEFRNRVFPRLFDIIKKQNKNLFTKESNICSFEPYLPRFIFFKNVMAKYQTLGFSLYIGISQYKLDFPNFSFLAKTVQEIPIYRFD